MLCRAPEKGWIIVESSDKMWSTGRGNGKPLQYSFLENPTDRGAWWATIHGVTKRQINHYIMIKGSNYQDNRTLALNYMNKY